MNNERFARMAAELKAKHHVDVVADILLGRTDRIFFVAENGGIDTMKLTVVSGSLETIGFPDADEIAMKTIVADFELANAYAEVAGADQYREYVCGQLNSDAPEPNVTFPIRRGGRRIWINVLMNPVKGHPALRSVFITDMTTMMDAEEQNYIKSHRDSLTGLFNKYTLDFHYGERYRMPDFHVLYLDLDDFKLVNDHYGHVAGDRFLAAFAEILKSHQKNYDLFYRLGGDEFVGLLFGPEAEIRKTAVDILDRTRGIELPGAPRVASVSIGIVRAKLCEDVISKADRVMYRVKNSGKDGYRYEIEHQE